VRLGCWQGLGSWQTSGMQMLACMGFGKDLMTRPADVP
jgi:hypothetical protein